MNDFRPEDRNQLAIVILAAMTLLAAVILTFSDSRSIARMNDEINMGR